MFLRTEDLETRLGELDRQLMDPSISGQRDRYRQVTREHSEVSRLVGIAHQLRDAEAERADNPETWRKPRVRALLASAELSGK